MPELKTSTRTTISVQDWDDFVTEVYGRPYSFQQQDGCKDRGTCELEVSDEYDPEFTAGYDNDTIPDDVDTNEMCVSLKGWLARDPKQPLANQKYDFELRSWWERNFYPQVDVLAQDLWKRGLLKAGKYTIIIDW